ncbi:MAG TPA: hypothetical protein VJ063_11770 [Verrucomicrobiae bacterium]|nr:hypothetical protein [Verrucomicrobiae bacterium]
MKSTLIPVCVFTAALIAVDAAFADDKRTPSPRGREIWDQVPTTPNDAKARTTAVSATPAKVKSSPAKRLWVGRTVIISPSERDIIRGYVRNRLQASKGGKFNGVPQGLAKKVAWPNNLPAGWQKNCVRGKALPEEVHEHCQPLPEELTAKLPPPPPGTVLLAVDGTVVRVGYPTYEILDLFDVLAPPAELMGPRPARPALQRLAAADTK